MDDLVEVDIPELDPPVVFTVGNAKAYVDPWDGGVLWVHCGNEAFDDVAVAAINEQAEHHGFPVLTGVDIEHGEGEPEPWVSMWFSRSLSDALAC